MRKGLMIKRSSFNMLYAKILMIYNKLLQIIYNERSTDEEGFDTLNDDEGWVDTHHYASEQVSSSLGSIVEAKFMETSESSVRILFIFLFLT